VVWIVAVGLGATTLLRYSGTPGKAATPTRDWPGGTSIQRARARATLVLFLHPQCPCSRASIEELAQIVAERQGKLDVSILFYAPEQKTSEWVRAGLWDSARAIPGVHEIEDHQGVEARRFRAATSGQALLYNAAGHLAFSGGITRARAHSGANDGREAIVAAVLDGPARRTNTPVFGCGLLGEEYPQEVHP
jgi:hypothetical protein